MSQTLSQFFSEASASFGRSQREVRQGMWRVAQEQGWAFPSPATRRLAFLAERTGLSLDEDSLGKQIDFLSFCFFFGKRNQSFGRKYAPIFTEDCLGGRCVGLASFLEDYFGAKGSLREGTCFLGFGPDECGKTSRLMATIASLGFTAEVIDLARFKDFNAVIHRYSESVKSMDIKINIRQQERPRQIRGKRVRQSPWTSLEHSTYSSETDLSLTGQTKLFFAPPQPRGPPIATHPSSADTSRLTKTSRLCRSQKVFLFCNFDFFRQTVYASNPSLACKELQKLAGFAKRSRLPFVLEASTSASKMLLRRMDLVAERIDPPSEAELLVYVALVSFFELNFRDVLSESEDSGADIEEASNGLNERILAVIQEREFRGELLSNSELVRLVSIGRSSFEGMISALQLSVLDALMKRESRKSITNQLIDIAKRFEIETERQCRPPEIEGINENISEESDRQSHFSMSKLTLEELDTFLSFERAKPAQTTGLTCLQKRSRLIRSIREDLQMLRIDSSLLSFARELSTWKFAGKSANFRGKKRKISPKKFENSKHRPNLSVDLLSFEG